MAESLRKPGIWFVYRSHYEGPLSKRLRRLDAPSVLAWFQERFADARGAAAPRDVGEAELGGYVYGFGTLFEAVKEHRLPTPKTMAGLDKQLRKHLYVEGGSDHIRVNDHTLRVATDDDEVDLAYFFFDDDAARQHPDRVAWLLHDEPRLPEGDAEGPFEPPFAPAPILPRGDGEGATYACLLTLCDNPSIPGTAAVIPGVRLPELAAHLRRVIPEAKTVAWSATYRETWPFELRLLRALLEPGEERLGPALGRCAAYPLDGLMRQEGTALLGLLPHAEARAELLARAEGLEHDGDPSKSIVHESAHAALLCAHATSAFGYQQWILFDDRWAAAHPALAASILRYAHGWDPFPYRKAPELSPEEAAAASTKKKERAWSKALEGRTAAQARTYKPSDRFALNEVLQHAKFGLGLVQRVEDSRIEVLFKDGPRVLAHGMAAGRG